MIPLRWRLALWFSGISAVGLLGFLLISFQVLSSSLLDEIDLTLAERANHVSDAVAVVPNRPIQGISPDATDEFRSPGIYLQIHNLEGKVIAHSFNLGNQQLPVTKLELEQVLSGDTLYQTTQIDQLSVRLFHQPIKRNGEIVGTVQVGQSLAGMQFTLQRLQRIYGIGTGIVILFSLMGGLILANIGLKPVEQLTQAARKLMHVGAGEQRIPYVGPADEIGNLATTFNEMLGRLQILIQSQRQFLTEAAHELRTPISSMLGNVDLLSRYGNDAFRREEILSGLQRTGQHVTRLLDDLLMIAQVDAGWKLDLGPIDISDVLLEAITATSMINNNVELDLGKCESAWVFGDADRLRQVFINIIDNAIKYSNFGDTVSLDLWCKDQRAWIQVHNSGLMIPNKMIPKVFEPYFRLSEKAHIPGMGLGLTIARWIIHEHNGEIEINSIQDIGTQVTISIPEHNLN